MRDLERVIGTPNSTVDQPQRHHRRANKHLLSRSQSVNTRHAILLLLRLHREQLHAEHLADIYAYGRDPVLRRQDERDHAHDQRGDANEDL
jgi:hypothetical protein